MNPKCPCALFPDGYDGPNHYGDMGACRGCWLRNKHLDTCPCDTIVIPAAIAQSKQRYLELEAVRMETSEGDRGLKDLYGIWNADFSEEDIDRAQWRSSEQEADRD